MQLLLAALVAFLFGFLTYRKGLQDGLNINKGRELQPINPVQSVVNTAVQAKQTVNGQKANADLMKQLSNIMAYTGDEKEE